MARHANASQYDAGPQAVQKWREKYRITDGGISGSAGLYALSRRELLYWYHVEGLRGAELADGYRAQTGICAFTQSLAAAASI